MKLFSKKAAILLVTGALAVAAVGSAYAGSPISSAGSNVGLHDAGAGMHVGPSTVNQVASFTLNPNEVFCAVGTVDALGAFGAFEMLMYSLSVDSYKVDRTAHTITATGKMRSVTRIAGLVVEDTDGVGLDPAPIDYLAIGTDNASAKKADTFELHFKSPQWNTTNPLCTASDKIPGGCKFGDPVFLGNVVVGDGV